jgi:protein phosphatase 4 regulatory subunit 3
VAALTLLSHNETTSELSLQQHLDIAPDLVAYNHLATEGDAEPLMMAQPVPHQATDKKRVKVYELRNNDWFDRGTGFCTATFTTVRAPPMYHPIFLICTSCPLLHLFFFLFLFLFLYLVTDQVPTPQTEDGRKDPRVIVESEDHPERLLLETKIQKEDGFQKQQGIDCSQLNP